MWLVANVILLWLQITHFLPSTEHPIFIVEGVALVLLCVAKVSNDYLNKSA